MSCWVVAPNHYCTIKMQLTYNDVHGMLGDFRKIKLLSGDILCVQADPRDELNDFASTLLNKPIRGDVVVTEKLL